MFSADGVGEGLSRFRLGRQWDSLRHTQLRLKATILIRLEHDRLAVQRGKLHIANGVYPPDPALKVGFKTLTRELEQIAYFSAGDSGGNAGIGGGFSVGRGKGIDAGDLYGSDTG